MGDEEKSVLYQTGSAQEANDEIVRKKLKTNKKLKRLFRDAKKAEKRGVCYLSRIPPHMDPLKLRQILSQFGEIQRIYLTPQGAANQMQRKKNGGFRMQEFSEGWVEFTQKSVAKRVAKMLNGEQIGGKKRSSFYYDIWNIKYLSKFKWDDLTEEIAYKNATREQKLALELSAAKRERDFYLSKVDQSRANTFIEERLKKKQKLSGAADDQQPTMFVRQYHQKNPVTENARDKKPSLSKDVLAGIFGGGEKSSS
ncbi:hypothetical protein Leryth_004854 [Lithospermum erythrorhizon]|nr:hypothetical protein Leryth_004854 [Lithospermum erythrorhizon]